MSVSSHSIDEQEQSGTDPCAQSNAVDSNVSQGAESIEGNEHPAKGIDEMDDERTAKKVDDTSEEDEQWTEETEARERLDEEDVMETSNDNEAAEEEEEGEGMKWTDKEHVDQTSAMTKDLPTTGNEREAPEPASSQEGDPVVVKTGKEEGGTETNGTSAEPRRGSSPLPQPVHRQP